MNSMDLRREDFVKLYATAPGIIKFLENSIEETKQTLKVDVLDLPLNVNIVTIRMNKMNLER